jgi:hypothetical protein
MVDYWGAVKRPFLSIKEFSVGVGLSLIMSLFTASTVLLNPDGLNVAVFALVVVLMLFGFILNLILTGYSLLCAATSMKKEQKLPKWSNFIGLLLTGLSALGIGLIYGIPLLILAIVVYGKSLFTANNLTTVVSAVGIGTTVVFLLLLLTSYIIPIALMNYIKNGFKSAFDLEFVLRKAFTTKYFAAFLVVIVYVLLTSSLIAFVQVLGNNAIIAFIGYLLTAILSIAIRITSMSIYGAVFSEL